MLQGFAPAAELNLLDPSLSEIVDSSEHHVRGQPAAPTVAPRNAKIAPVRALICRKDLCMNRTPFSCVDYRVDAAKQVVDSYVHSGVLIGLDVQLRADLIDLRAQCLEPGADIVTSLRDHVRVVKGCADVLGELPSALDHDLCLRH